MRLKPARIRDSYIIIWATMTAILVLTCAALGIGLAAVSHANTTAECLNNVLRTRQNLTTRDHLNEAQKIADQVIAVDHQAQGIRLVLTTDRVQQERGALLYQQGVNEFKQALADWQARDNQIAAERARHPLGRC